MEVTKLYKKLNRLERKYSKLGVHQKIQAARIRKSYLATARKIERITGRELQ